MGGERVHVEAGRAGEWAKPKGGAERTRVRTRGCSCSRRRPGTVSATMPPRRWWPAEWQWLRTPADVAAFRGSAVVTLDPECSHCHDLYCTLIDHGTTCRIGIHVYQTASTPAVLGETARAREVCAREVWGSSLT